MHTSLTIAVGIVVRGSVAVAKSNSSRRFQVQDVGKFVPANAN